MEGEENFKRKGKSRRRNRGVSIKENDYRSESKNIKIGVGGKE